MSARARPRARSTRRIYSSPRSRRGEIQVIGATTPEEYRKHIEKDAALERRFQPVNVPEPDAAACEEMLYALLPKLERHHNLAIADAAVRAAVRLSSRYICDRRLPDKAVDLLDEAAAAVHLRSAAGATVGDGRCRRDSLGVDGRAGLVDNPERGRPATEA